MVKYEVVGKKKKKMGYTYEVGRATGDMMSVWMVSPGRYWLKAIFTDYIIAISLQLS